MSQVNNSSYGKFETTKEFSKMVLFRPNLLSRLTAVSNVNGEDSFDGSVAAFYNILNIFTANGMGNALDTTIGMAGTSVTIFDSKGWSSSTAQFAELFYVIMPVCVNSSSISFDITVDGYKTQPFSHQLKDVARTVISAVGNGFDVYSPAGQTNGNAGDLSVKVVAPSVLVGKDVRGVRAKSIKIVANFAANFSPLAPTTLFQNRLYCLFRAGNNA